MGVYGDVFGINCDGLIYIFVVEFFNIVDFGLLILCFLECLCMLFGKIECVLKEIILGIDQLKDDLVVIMLNKFMLFG